MRSLSNAHVNDRLPAVPMPAAMLPFPAPAGSDWSFQNPVGVDCSSPEPRCIWVAVLRGITGPPPVAAVGHRSFAHQLRAKGRRDGLSSPATDNNPRPPMASRPGRDGVSAVWKGPRTLVLRKNSQGFGFTLRHFIVYPPESTLYTNLTDEENGNGKGFQKVRLEPMDTIFVKNVREKGPAHQAGLCTGDRLVKVNGESVLGKTYSQVIALIQNSESVLELSIMPKDDDVLQLAYSQDAYLTGNEPFTGGAENLPPPPPLCYPRTKTMSPAGVPPPAPMGQNQLDNWSRWPNSPSPSSPLDNRSAVCSPASWQDGRSAELGGVGHSSPAHRTEEIQYGMTGQQPQGQTRGRSYSSSSSSGGPLSSPLQVHYPNHHHGANSTQSQARKSSSSAWTSPPLPHPGHGRSERCQQALSEWYHSQVPERSGRNMQTRQRSYSQDRLSESRRQPHLQRAGGWAHSASQDTLLLLQQSGPGPHGEPYWGGEWGPERGHPASNYTRTRSENLLVQFDRRGRSMEMLDRSAAGMVGPQCERWHQPPKPPPRTDIHQRHGGPYPATQGTQMARHSQPHSKHPTQTHSPVQSQQAAPKNQRLPPGQSMDDQPVGYRSYSPSFYRKTGRIMQQAHSFRDPSYSGPHMNWNTTPKTSPPEGAPVISTAAPLASISPESQERAYRPTNHERGSAEVPVQTQEVVMRQKPPSGRRNAHGLRHPHYALPMDGLEPSLFSPEPPDSAATSSSSGDAVPFKANGNLVPLSLEDDSLASIPFIAITAERSKSCDEGLNAFREEGRVFSRLPKRVKSFFTDGSLDNLGTAEEVRSKRHSTSELGNITYSDVRREGWLNFKQILTEKGKKVGSGMRPWKRVFSVLRSHSLFLYKDKREAVLRGATLGGGAEDEQPISIRGCLVDIAYSETKRKHALRLTTQDFCEYLLQAEDRDHMLDWIQVIRENSKTDSEELGFSGHALINKKLNDYRKQSPTGSKPDSSPRMSRMKPPFLLAKTENALGAPRSPKQDGKDESSPPKSPWGINIMKKTKKTGPKAFGVRLEDCQPGINNKFIPLIVEICCGLVEDMGLEYTGIYRVPGNNAMVSLLQEQLNKGVDINPAEEKWQDLNVVSSLLKSFFRKLPEPLFTNDKYNDFIDANRMEDASDRLKTMKKLIRDLPDYYYHTLKFLVCHLKTVADHSDKNKMEPRNLALVFGPTLVRTSEDNMKDMVTHMPDRYKIVETLIQHYLWFFSEEPDKDEKTPEDTEDVQPAPNIDHLLSNIGRTALLGDASDSTNSDSAKSKGSWGSKKDLTAKDFLTLSIMSAVTGRKRRKCHNARRVGSSTDDDSEHEPVTVEEEQVGDGARHPEGEEDDDEEEAEKGEVKAEEAVVKNGKEEEEAGGRADARSIVSGYSTLSTLGRSLGAEDADDEHSELVSETDNESGFASRERPGKPPPPPPKPSALTVVAPEKADDGGGARSTTPSSTSSSHRLHSRPSFNSHKLIQCDTLARKRMKARSLDLLAIPAAAAPTGENAPRTRRDTSSGSSQENLRPSRARLGTSLPPSESASFAPSPKTLAEQVRARLLGSAEDLRSVGMRKPLSPESRRKRRAWRRHTVVASPTEAPIDKRPPLTEFPLSPATPKTPSPSQGDDVVRRGSSGRHAPTSRFHQYL
ncbi:rho GTPase-activating protein 23 isoform X4 [Syngnathoides biaculeatus]|uniref:rho GTPase-activating protein 23 isoform X4 n=1 Tax=Syngnathoides biaculeatus TaxID=300417 RepID=UPI002ADE692C|nr:rho GTPase-activating protein 23 isoform X4 [Syngnathoides biaculeatus]